MPFVMFNILDDTLANEFRKTAAEIDRLGFEETIRMVARKEAEGLTITFLRLGGGQSWRFPGSVQRGNDHCFKRPVTLSRLSYSPSPSFDRILQPAYTY
jgi:hypothetical protein